MKITKNAQTVLEKRYLIRDAENKPRGNSAPAL